MVVSQLRPSPEHIETSEPTPVPQQLGEKHDVDVEIQKSEAQRQDVEPGVAGVEALQVLWGKRGKYLVVARLGMVMIM